MRLNVFAITPPSPRACTPGEHAILTNILLKLLIAPKLHITPRRLLSLLLVLLLLQGLERHVDRLGSSKTSSEGAEKVRDTYKSCFESTRTNSTSELRIRIDRFAPLGRQGTPGGLSCLELKVFREEI